MPETQGPPVHEDKSIEQLADELLQILADRARRRPVLQDGKLGAPIWTTAAEIAELLAIREGGSTDSRKRGARHVINYVTETWPGKIFRSDRFLGIALVQCPEDLAMERRFRRKMGLPHLAAESDVKHSIAQDDAAGQLRIDPATKVDRPSETPAEPAEIETPAEPEHVEPEAAPEEPGDADPRTDSGRPHRDPDVGDAGDGNGFLFDLTRAAGNPMSDGR